MKCIYCGTDLVSPSNEHIILSSLGSHLASTKLICADCNNAFSNNETDIDKEFSRQFDVFKNLLDIRSGRGYGPPTLKAGHSEAGKQYDIAAGGQLRLSKSSRTVERKSDSEYGISIAAPNLQKAMEQMYHLRRQFPDAKIETVAKSGKDYLQNPVHFSLSFGGNPGLRAVMKGVFNFIYYIEREKGIPIIGQPSELDAARQLIRYNTPSAHVYGSLDCVNVRAPAIGNDISNKLYAFGSRERHLVFGYYIVFGQISFSSVLSESYSGDDFGFRYLEDPVSGEHSFGRVGVDNTFDSGITKDYSKNVERHSEEMERRMAFLMSYYQERSQRETIASIIKEGYEKCFPKIGEVITEKHVADLSRYIAQEFVKHHFRIGSEEAIDIGDGA